jgi:gamma-glutamylcyclotransferase (GGCT)/AIG2-like uncharacterized protein YtfP
MRRALLWLLPAALILAPLLGWYVWLSPIGYRAPPGLTPIDPALTQRVFVYGTLRYPLVRRVVTGRWIETRDAALPGYVRSGLDLEARAGGTTRGEVFVASAQVLARLDRYERLGIRYERVRLPLADGGPAWVYRRLPEP